MFGDALCCMQLLDCKLQFISSTESTFNQIGQPGYPQKIRFGSF